MSKFHDLDYDQRVEYLRELAAKVGNPLIAIEELTEVGGENEEGEYVPDYSGSYLIDPLKFVESDSQYVDLGSLSYVGHIIEAALLGKTSYGSSRKYSFGDTPDWWTVFAPDTEKGREKVTIEVAVYY